MEVSGWYKIKNAVSEIFFQPNYIAQVTVNGIPICIAKFQNQLFAFSNKCPHASADMHEGYVDGKGYVVCSLHHYKFSLKNGRNLPSHEYCLKIWPVHITTEGAFVGLTNNQFTSYDNNIPLMFQSYFITEKRPKMCFLTR